MKAFIGRLTWVSLFSGFDLLYFHFPYLKRRVHQLIAVRPYFLHDEYGYIANKQSTELITFFLFFCPFFSAIFLSTNQRFRSFGPWTNNTGPWCVITFLLIDHPSLLPQQLKHIDCAQVPCITFARRSLIIIFYVRHLTKKKCLIDQIVGLKSSENARNRLDTSKCFKCVTSIPINRLLLLHHTDSPNKNHDW